MRVDRFLASVLLPALLLTAAACTDDVTRVGGSAAPVVADSTAAPSPSLSVSPSPATPSSRAPTSPPAAKKSTSPAAIRTVVLGPSGLGKLKLGMTTKQATATGLIAPWKKTQNNTDCSQETDLLAGPGGQGGATGFVYYSTAMGVQIIDGYPGVRTPEGIRFGSTRAQVQKAYADGQEYEGFRFYTKVPGNDHAYYRIEIENGKVVDITLQHENQTCYE